jgi:plastocyanin
MQKSVMVCSFLTTSLIAILLLSSCSTRPIGELPRSLYIQAVEPSPQFSPMQISYWVSEQHSWSGSYWPSVMVEFKNDSTQLHRLVLIVGNQSDAEAIVTASSTQPEYDPPPHLKIIAKSALLSPHYTQAIQLDGTPGEYLFFCTVPGHYQAGMQGKLVIKE